MYRNSSNSSPLLALPEIAELTQFIESPKQTDDDLLKLESDLHDSFERVSAATEAQARLEEAQLALMQTIRDRQSTISAMQETMKNVESAFSQLHSMHAYVDEARKQMAMLAQMASSESVVQEALTAATQRLDQAEEVLEGVPVLAMRRAQLESQVDESHQNQNAQLTSFQLMLVPISLREKLSDLTGLLAKAKCTTAERLSAVVSESMSFLSVSSEKVSTQAKLISALEHARKKMIIDIVAWLRSHTHAQTPQNASVFSVARSDKVYGFVNWYETRRVSETGVSPDFQSLSL